MKSILVVEDDLDLREGLCEILEGEGYSVTSAENGKVALEILYSVQQLPNLIFLDIMMPIMDGHTFLKIQMADERLASIPVVVNSAGSNVRDALSDCKVALFLKKPAELDEILNAQKFLS